MLLIYKLFIMCPSRDTANLSMLFLKCLEPLRDVKTILILICVNVAGPVYPCIWISEMYQMYTVSPSLQITSIVSS